MKSALALIDTFVQAYCEDSETLRVLKIGQMIRSRGYATLKELLKLVKWKFPISIRHVNIPNNTKADVKKLTHCH